MASNKTKKALSPEKKKLSKGKAAFKRKIYNTFTGAGFTYIPTNDKEMHIGFRKIEIDSFFLYKNIANCNNKLDTPW